MAVSDSGQPDDHLGAERYLGAEPDLQRALVPLCMWLRISSGPAPPAVHDAFVYKVFCSERWSQGFKQSA